jgi:hypothetical protein
MLVITELSFVYPKVGFRQKLNLYIYAFETLWCSAVLHTPKNLKEELGVQGSHYLNKSLIKMISQETC